MNDEEARRLTEHLARQLREFALEMAIQAATGDSRKANVQIARVWPRAADGEGVQAVMVLRVVPGHGFTSGPPLGVN